MTTAILLIFITGYAAIALEHSIRLNKAASALITGVLCWTVYVLWGEKSGHANDELTEHLGDISGILFFLLGAMTIVELIDAHDGFDVISSRIRTSRKIKLLWIIGLLTFFLSAVLDNLTTTIVMVSLVAKIIPDKKTRQLFCGLIVIAANTGGAWSPIGDITTTMLWIGGQISVSQIIFQTFLPSLICLLVPLLLLSFQLKGNIGGFRNQGNSPKKALRSRDRNIVFIAGITSLILVPVFKSITHLPPFMGMMLALGLMWVVTEIVHSGKDTSDKDFLSVLYALRKIDSSSILFFLGILISVAALQSAGMLSGMSEWLTGTFKNDRLVVSVIGLLSAIVDNVPLVAASIGMYSLEQYPVNHEFWLLLAFCAGTGGSMLIIGSAAGVAAMGIEKMSFFWYLKNIGWLALLGYIAGILFFLLQQQLL